MNCALQGKVPPGLMNPSPEGTFATSPQFTRGWVMPQSGNLAPALGKALAKP
jgi:hypothetical protein